MSVNISVYEIPVPVWLTESHIQMDPPYFLPGVCKAEFVNYMYLLSNHYHTFRWTLSVFCRWGYC